MNSGIVGAGRCFGDGQGCRVGEPVGGSDHERVEDVPPVQTEFRPLSRPASLFRGRSVKYFGQVSWALASASLSSSTSSRSSSDDRRAAALAPIEGVPVVMPLRRDTDA